MERIKQIYEHELWKFCYRSIQNLEQDRAFCRHDISHFLDVARIAQIENMEQERQIPKAWIYAAALLHDIGKHLQYTKQIPHEQSSAVLAESILRDCGFTALERREILEAILEHRNAETKEKQNLAGLIYRADKRSRVCLFCAAKDACNWSEKKKNREIIV